jgi:predicted nucleotide-binding protein
MRRIADVLHDKSSHKALRMFIVHGHDDQTKYELKNFIQNSLKLGEPIILHEQPSLGRTIIEKLEDEASDIDIVFVILTPDDVGRNARMNKSTVKRRARQNVIFELGYFLGKLDRRGGRVLLLYKGDLDLPSDISGVIYININNGIDAAGEIIRRELVDVL